MTKAPKKPVPADKLTKPELLALVKRLHKRIERLEHELARMRDLAAQGASPFGAPNATTVAALQEAETGGGDVDDGYLPDDGRHREPDKPPAEAAKLPGIGPVFPWEKK